MSSKKKNKPLATKPTKEAKARLKQAERDYNASVNQIGKFDKRFDKLIKQLAGTISEEVAVNIIEYHSEEIRKFIESTIEDERCFMTAGRILDEAREEMKKTLPVESSVRMVGDAYDDANPNGQY